MIAKRYLEFSSECYCWLVWDRVNNSIFFLISTYCFQSRYEPMKAVFFFWLHMVFVAAQGLSLAATSGVSSLVGVPRLLLFRVHTSGSWASVAVAHRLSCSVTCGIFLDQGSNVCLLRWQAHSLPLSHQGSPWFYF